MMAEMLVRCPSCEESFDLAARQRPAGAAGGSFCPHCHERFAIPGPSKTISLVSLAIAVGFLFLVGVRSLIVLAVGSALLWIPISLFLGAARMRSKGIVLRKWKPRRKTFFEWLYERGSTPALFDGKSR
jgi:hypothetical protein